MSSSKYYVIYVLKSKSFLCEGPKWLNWRNQQLEGESELKILIFLYFEINFPCEKLRKISTKPLFRIYLTLLAFGLRIPDQKRQKCRNSLNFGRIATF